MYIFIYDDLKTSPPPTRFSFYYIDCMLKNKLKKKKKGQLNCHLLPPSSLFIHYVETKGEGVKFFFYQIDNNNNIILYYKQVIY